MAGTGTLSGQREFHGLLTELRRGGGVREIDRIEAAYEIAAEVYKDTVHWTGIPVLSHVLGVLRNLLPFAPDDDVAVACLLHHILDAKAWTLEELEEKFGERVRSIVSSVHLLSHVTTKNRRMSIENLRLMLLRVSDDARAVLIILCEQCAILEHLRRLPSEEQRRVCQDVLRLFAPVAARLGIYTLKHTLESYAFPVVYPTDAERIHEQLGGARGRHGAFLPKAAALLKRTLREHGMEARVEGREKQPYSLFLKMRAKSLTQVSDLYDLFALRVIVADEGACYQVLGLLHRIGHPVPNRFKDFIAFPKPNGYQSLHTTVARLPGVPESVFLEVQVRTESMHREAEYGIAAHWSYKEGGSAERAARRAQLQRMLTSQYSVGEPGGRGDASLQDHIFVLTPRGDIVELPEGATPLDFAFALHTQLGLLFRSAKVNGSIVAMDHALENGDVVEIQKQGTPRPSPRWIDLLKTASARARLRRYLSSQDRPANVASGRELLNEELARRGLPPLDGDLSLLKGAGGRHLTVAEREEILASIGHGTTSASTVVHQLALTPPPRKAPRAARGARTKGPLVLVADDALRMPMKTAKCCKPESAPGCDVVGVVSRGAVRVHRAGCRMLKQVNAERRIGVHWER